MILISSLNFPFAKNCFIIKEELLKLYLHVVKPTSYIYIDLTMINNGFKYKVLDTSKNNEVLDKGKIVFKSNFSWLLYLIHLIGRKN